MTKKLFKTTIVIWTDYDTESMDIEDLGREAERGNAYNSRFKCEEVEKPENDSDWDETEFFNND